MRKSQTIKNILTVFIMIILCGCSIQAAEADTINGKTEQGYAISTIPVYGPKANSDGNPFPSVEILDLWDYGLVSAYCGDQLYRLNPASLELEKMMVLKNGTGKMPNWYCGKIIPRYTPEYDYLLLWDQHTKKMYHAATDGTYVKSFEEQKLGWLRNTGIDMDIGSNVVHGTIIYAEYYLEGFNVDTDTVKVWRSTDQGRTWTAVFSQNCRQSESSEIYHFLFVRRDPYNEGHWYLGSGDTPDESNIWRSVDDGLTWTKINDPLFSGELQSVHRTCNLYFTEDYIYWGTDDSVTAYGTGHGGKWCRSPRNIETNQLSVEVLAELGDWVRITQETPYGVFLATEKRFEDKAYVWMAPYEDLEHPRLVARTDYGFGSQISNASYGSRLFFASPWKLYPATYSDTRLQVIDIRMLPQM